jgi:uncharacterized membrane-anchored protein
MRWIIGPLLRVQFAIFFLSCVALSCAQAEEQSARELESRAAWKAADVVMKRGPQEIELRDQAKLQLPDGYGFIPTKEAARVMSAMGNQTDSRFIGLVIPLRKENWFVTVDFEPAGYIKDDDAKDWKADELLDSLKEGTEAGNKRRVDLGIAPIQVTRWIEPPKYDANKHHLVWSAEARLKSGDDPDPTINYNTYVLGREGYVSMDLITTSSTIATDKRAATELLAGVQFDSGKRYGDFNSSTDKVAAYGLAALIGGVVAKKLGLLAVIGVFLAKFAKVIALGAAAFGGGLVKWFRRDKAGAAKND